MKKQINDLLLKMQNGENCIGETANKLLDLYSVSITLLNKDAAICKGYNKAKRQDYQNRYVLRHKDQDDYYSGWMDCYDWISKGN